MLRFDQRSAARRVCSPQSWTHAWTRRLFLPPVASAAAAGFNSCAQGLANILFRTYSVGLTVEKKRLAVEVDARMRDGQMQDVKLPRRSASLHAAPTGGSRLRRCALGVPCVCHESPGCRALSGSIGLCQTLCQTSVGPLFTVGASRLSSRTVPLLSRPGPGMGPGVESRCCNRAN